MPKDSHLLPPHSQALLRAARRGQVFRPPAPPVEEDKENGDDEDAEGDIELGFVATKWGVVPRHLEGPEPEFLAKRRKGLGSLYGAVSGAVVASSQMRETKIKKTDSEGHEYVLKALVPEGQTLVGEVAAGEGTISEAPAPGTIVEGVGIVNAEGVVIAETQVQPTPPRRKPPPPKKRAKGPGRGRRKRVAFAPGAGEVGPSRGFDGSSDIAATGEGGAHLGDGGNQFSADGDIEMGDDSLLHEGEEGSEEDEEGEDGEDGDREDGELSPSPVPVPVSPPENLPRSDFRPEQVPTTADTTTSIMYPRRDLSSSPDLPLAANQGPQPPIIHVEPAEPIDLSEPPSILEIQEAPSIVPPLIDEPSHLLDSVDPISVEDPPRITHPVVQGELPLEHNPLEGLSEPKAPSNEQAENNLQFPDGEEDLLGSLEASLENRD